MSGASAYVVASVAVVGRDASLWLTTAALAEALGPLGVAVTAVELPTLASPACVYGALPALEALHARLGFDEAALLRASGGSYSLGWNVSGASAAPFFLAHGSYGAPIDGRAFFPYWAKARRHGLDAAFEDFSPTAAAARHGRLLLPDDDTLAFGRADYGYHLPALPYLAAIKSRAARLGAAILHTRTITVERTGDDIASVVLDGGEHVAADIFIDATGAEAALIGGARRSWRSMFPATRRLAARGARLAGLPIYSDLRAVKAGWLSLRASQTVTEAALYYADQDGQQAWADLRTAAGMALDEPVATALEPGRAERLWSGNCVAIGPSACAFDPVFDLELHGIQLGIVHLLALFPIGSEATIERAEYDRVVGSHLERLRDFQAAAYALSRAAGRFWDQARAARLPLDVTHRLTTFRARGAVAPFEDDAFDADLWQALFVGMGEMPDTWSPAIDRTSPELMKAEFRRILGFVRDKVLEAPRHEDYLTRTGARSS